MNTLTNDPNRITVLRQSATLTGLQNQGTPAHPKSEPPCRLSGIDVALSGAGDNACGIWECTPGRFMRQLREAEVMHILAGRGRFTPNTHAACCVVLVAKRAIENASIGVEVAPVAISSAITSPAPGPVAKPSPLKPNA
jgi:uncharacterized cupin superfamily protein